MVTDYFVKAGVLEDLEALGFDLVGYGCTTCIGNCGPLKPEISAAVKAGDLIACAVLSGNRNFEGRVHPEVRMNFLASPPLVVAYALAGTLDIDLTTEPLGTGSDGKPVYLADIWPSDAEVQDLVLPLASTRRCSARATPTCSRAMSNWAQHQGAAGQALCLGREVDLREEPALLRRHEHDAGAAGGHARRARARGARRLGHHRPHLARRQHRQSRARRRAISSSRACKPADFNSYGARRGNHEVMMRGTFANIRLRNLLVPGAEGGVTVHLPERRADCRSTTRPCATSSEGTPLVILAGREYGTGSSRDWAAKGTMLLGVKAVIAESFERIHRSNLIGMGVLPLQFRPGQNVAVARTHRA